MHSTSEFAKIVLSKCVIHAGFVTVAWTLRGIPFQVGEWTFDLISEFTFFNLVLRWSKVKLPAFFHLITHRSSACWTIARCHWESPFLIGSSCIAWRRDNSFFSLLLKRLTDSTSDHMSCAWKANKGHACRYGVSFFFPTLTCGVFVFSSVSAFRLPPPAASRPLTHTHPLTHPLTHPTHSLTLTHSHSHTHSHTHTHTHALTLSLTHSLIHSLTHTLTLSLTHSLAHSLTRSLAHSLTRSLAHSLTRSLTHSLTHLCMHIHTHTQTHPPSPLHHSYTSSSLFAFLCSV